LKTVSFGRVGGFNDYPQLTREVTFELPNTRRRFFPVFIALAAFSGSLNAQTVRFQTTLGGIDVVLTPSVTPVTVANFMSYVNSGGYADTIIHRSLTIAAAVPPYVIQGGGYVLNGLVPILTPQNPPITNEFNISNTRGTLAMALSGSGINSATNEWFFNTADNSGTLDSQDFTVFGNVANDAGLAVMDAINALPTYLENYGQDANFMDLPLNNYTCCDSIPKSANFVFVNSITPISPAILAAGVTNAATALSNSSTGISPGEMLTLYGQNFANNPPAPSYLGPTQVTTLRLDSTGTTVISSLEGTEVLFNGFPGPMIFTSDGQIAVIVPYEIANQGTVSVVVSYLGIQSSPMQFNVVPANPGLFTLNQSGKGDAAIVRASDGSVVSTASPAKQGDSLQLYGEGYGVTSPILPDGVLVGSALPVPIVLLIDGKVVPTLYAGTAGSALNGMMQVNFLVPQQMAPGSHQIQVKVGNAVSPAGVTLQTM
jgi:uncharacterized protein (TIGR03437 family)